VERRVPGVAGVVEDGILPGWFGYETGQAAMGDALDWVHRLCGQDHDSLAAAAGQVPIGAEGLVALDWFNGCRTPLMDGRLRGAVLGADLHHGPGHLYRATIEATACGLAWVVDTLRDGGLAIDRFVAVGGLARRSPLLVETIAAVIDAPVEVPDVEQPTALGAAVLAAVAGGSFESAAEAVASMTAPSRDGGGARRPLVVAPERPAVEAMAAVARRYRDAAALVASRSAAPSVAAPSSPPVPSPATRSPSPVPVPRPATAPPPTVRSAASRPAAAPDPAIPSARTTQEVAP